MAFHVLNIGSFVVIDLVQGHVYSAHEARELADALHDAARRAEAHSKASVRLGERFSDVTPCGDPSCRVSSDREHERR